MPSALSLPFFLQIMISIFTRAQITLPDLIKSIPCHTLQTTHTNCTGIYNRTDGSSISLLKISPQTQF